MSETMFPIKISVFIKNGDIITVQSQTININEEAERGGRWLFLALS